MQPLRILFVAVATLLLCAQASYVPGFPPGTFSSRRAIDATPSGGGCAEATAWLAKADAASTGYSATAQGGSTYGAQDTTFICYLVNNGAWTSISALYVTATLNTTVALLDMKASFDMTSNGGPTFTADQGYQGADASTTIFLDTTFNPTTQSLPQNDTHISAWSSGANTTASGAGGGIIIGAQSTGTSSFIIPRFVDNNFYTRINEVTAGGTTNSTAEAHYLGSRTGVSTEKAYKNAVDQSITAITSVSVPTASYYLLAGNNGGSATNGTPVQWQLRGASIGTGTSGAQTTVLCHGFNILFTARSGVAGSLC